MKQQWTDPRKLVCQRQTGLQLQQLLRFLQALQASTWVQAQATVEECRDTREYWGVEPFLTPLPRLAKTIKISIGFALSNTHRCHLVTLLIGSGALTL